MKADRPIRWIYRHRRWRWLILLCLAGIFLRASRFAPVLGEERSMSQFTTWYVGTVVGDGRFVPLRGADPRAEKVECAGSFGIGGGAFNSALADLLAGGSPTLAAITGPDDLGGLLVALARRTGLAVEQVPTAKATRMSGIIDGPHPRTFTTRPPLDVESTISTLTPHLAAADSVVFSSFTAAEAGLLKRLMAACPGRVGLALTRSQCEDRKGTLELARNAAWLVALNQKELFALTGVDDVVEGIEQARLAGVRNLFVTCGRAGIYAVVQGRWGFSRAYGITAKSTLCCGDFAFGTFWKELQAGEPVEGAVEQAAAAGAMVAAGVPWSKWNVRAFAASTPKGKFVPPDRLAPKPSVREVARTAATAAAVAAVTGLGTYLTAYYGYA